MGVVEKYPRPRNTSGYCRETPVGVPPEHHWEFLRNTIGNSFRIPGGVLLEHHWITPRSSNCLGPTLALVPGLLFLLPWASLSVRPSFRPTSLAPSPPFSGFPLSHSASGPGPHGAPGPPGAPSGGNDDAGRLRCRSLAGAGWLRQGLTWKGSNSFIFLFQPKQ